MTRGNDLILVVGDAHVKLVATPGAVGLVITQTGKRSTKQSDLVLSPEHVDVIATALASYAQLARREAAAAPHHPSARRPA